MEVEYRTIATTTTELLWLHKLLKELSHSIINTPQLFSDNIGATYLCVNPVFYIRIKHLALFATWLLLRNFKCLMCQQVIN